MVPACLFQIGFGVRDGRLKPGGWMLAGGPAAGEAIGTILEEAGIRPSEVVLSEVVNRGPEGVATFLVRKGAPNAPGEPGDQANEDHRPDG